MSLDVILKLRKDSLKQVKEYLVTNMEKNLNPSRKVLRAFYKFSADTYRTALRNQLLNAEGKGYASGSLFESIKVIPTGGHGGNWNKGWKETHIQLDVEMNKSGWRISHGTQDYAYATRIERWLRDKQASGTLNAILLDDEDFKTFAWNIAKLHKEQGGTAPSFPNWDNMEMNPDLRYDFQRMFNRGKQYHVNRITQSVIKKISK